MYTISICVHVHIHQNDPVCLYMDTCLHDLHVCKNSQVSTVRCVVVMQMCLCVLQVSFTCMQKDTCYNYVSTSKLKIQP